MIKMKVKKWLSKWFEKNSDLKLTEIEVNFNENYLQRGWIDSFKFISLVTDIEDFFKITFSADEFQNGKFLTAIGLQEIIEERIEKEI
jgi:acyl carrier protein